MQNTHHLPSPPPAAPRIPTQAPPTLKHLVSPGDIYGRLTVLAPPVIVNKIAKVAVKCTCGIEKQVNKDSLISGATTSCGCYRSEAAKARAAKSTLVGTYGSYTIKNRYPGANHLRYTCVCVCGESKVLRRAELLALPICTHKPASAPLKQASWCSMLYAAAK